MFCRLGLLGLVLGLPQPPRETYPYDVSFGALGHGFGLVDRAFPNVVELHGIPYASAPIGEKRFAVSELLETFPHEDMNFQEKPSVCIQSRFDGHSIIPWQPGASEDCLFLSIWAPKDGVDDPSKKYPVQVFFHGGAFMMGTGNFPDTDGTVIAERQNIVVVSVAYRLGVLGFAHNSEFLADSGSSGNFGFLDQRVALQWVNKYIHHVGGDPTDVTISGCSAGGQSTLVHLTSPDSWAYFNKVISFSGPMGLPFKNTEEAASYNAWFLKRVGCCLDDPEVCSLADVACLRARSVTEIQEAASDLRHRLEPIQNGKFTPVAEPWAVVIDGEVLTDNPMRHFQRGEIRPNTPFVNGINEEEGFIFAPSRILGPPLRYKKMMEQLYGDSSDKILDAYPPCTGLDCDSSPEFSAWMTDYSWTCSFQAAITPAIRPTNPVYGFLWNSPIPQTFNRTAMGILRKCVNQQVPCHCFETINYFGNAIRRGLELTLAEENYIEKVQNYLGNFIRTGNPNDFTGNPRGSMDFEELVNMRDSEGQLNVVGLNGQSKEHYRSSFCAVHDDIDEYLEH